MRAWLPALSLLATAGCFEYSPHAVVLDQDERDLHEKALARLGGEPPPEVLRFAVVGDTQLAFDEADEAIDHLNAEEGLSLVIQLGDFTNFGLLAEFRRMNDIFARLRVPYFVVIGNHDYLGNGVEIYERMFGSTRLAFTFARTRFLLFDSNSREVGFDGSVPDVPWLAAGLAPDGSHDRAVLLSHGPPDSSDFDPKLVAAYDQLLMANAPVISFHGHHESFTAELRAGTPLYVADRIDRRSYLVVTLGPADAMAVERVFF